MPPRETELYKDKVEVSLDGRQIFYLFFGGSVIVGIVFVLGVLVGRRVEARGHVDRARTHAAADPLAALDRLEGNGKLAFRASLSGKDTTTAVDKEIAAIEKARTSKGDAKPDAKSSKTEEPKSDVKVDAKSETKRETTSEKGDSKSEGKTEGKTEMKSDGKGEGKSESKGEGKSESKGEGKSESKGEGKSESKPVTKPDGAVEAKAEGKPESKSEGKTESKPDSRYTLQLSSFQDRAEAEAFLSSVKSQGFQAQITQADVEGKGTWYRVRTGSYRSMDAANDAKADLERATKKTATVMKL